MQSVIETDSLQTANDLLKTHLRQTKPCFRKGPGQALIVQVSEKQQKLEFIFTALAEVLEVSEYRTGEQPVKGESETTSAFLHRKSARSRVARQAIPTGYVNRSIPT